MTPSIVPATADICDAIPDLVSVADLPFRDYGAVPAFFGEVQTVKCFEDNTIVRRALEQPGHGRVLVVDGGGSVKVALLGDELAALAIENGWGGIIIEGSVRDVSRLGELPIGIKALASSPARSNKRGEGSIGVMVRMGRMDVRSGWWIYADADGVVTIPGPYETLAERND